MSSTNSKSIISTLILGALPFFVVAALVYSVATNSDPTTFNYMNFYDHSAIVGGLLSGSLHALTGADHMTALVPLIAGKRWWVGGTYGIVWGTGHGVTSSCIGLVSYLMKDKLINFNHSFESYRFLIDFIIGFTLIVIGLIGIYEIRHDEAERIREEEEERRRAKGQDVLARDIGDRRRGNTVGQENEQEEEEGVGAVPLRDSNTLLENGTIHLEYVPESRERQAGGGGGGVKSAATLLTVFVNGCVLGVSWDGLPSLAPTMVLELWSLLFLFLVSYSVGTILTMGFAAALVGELTCWLSKIAGEHTHIADRLAYLSSCAAGVIGVCWLVSAGVKFTHDMEATMVHNTNDNFQWSSRSTGHHMHVFLTAGSVLAVIGVILWGMYSEFAPQVRANANAVSSTGGGLMEWILRSAANKLTFSLSNMSRADDKLLVHKV